MENLWDQFKGKVLWHCHEGVTECFTRTAQGVDDRALLKASKHTGPYTSTVFFEFLRQVATLLESSPEGHIVAWCHEVRKETASCEIIN